MSNLIQFFPILEILERSIDKSLLLLLNSISQASIAMPLKRTHFLFSFLLHNQVNASDIDVGATFW